MAVLYHSTRNSDATVTASQAILKGLSAEGGLFVPAHIPALEKSLLELSRMSYQEVAYEVMKLMLSDFTEEELKACINNAYDKKFDTTKYKFRRFLRVSFPYPATRYYIPCPRIPRYPKHRWSFPYPKCRASSKG